MADLTFNPGMHLPVEICLKKCKNRYKKCKDCFRSSKYEPDDRNK